MKRFMAGLGGGALMVALALGAYIAFGSDLDRPEAAMATAPQEQAPAQTSQTAELSAPEPEATGTPAPSFDELRRESDGTTVIAGRAAPLSEVSILLDGATVATATADSSGGFAAIAVLPPKASAQVVRLSANTGLESIASQEEVILAPTTLPAPPPVADVAQVIAQQATPPAAEMTPPATEPTVPGPTPANQMPPPADTAMAVLKSDESGVSLLAPAQPRVTTEVALDTIGYSELGDVQLTGRARPDTANVRIYLDNRSVITLPVGADGRWRGDLPNVDEGLYTLRVDELDDAGAVSSRVETPFKRESAEILAQATPSGDGPVKSVTVQAGATLWAIARERYGDGLLYVRVFEANAQSIRDPDLIYPGQVFDLPN